MQINRINQTTHFGSAISIPKADALADVFTGKFAGTLEKVYENTVDIAKLTSPSETNTHYCFYFNDFQVETEDLMERLLIMGQVPYTRDKNVTSLELFENFRTGKHNDVGVIEATKQD